METTQAMHAVTRKGGDPAWQADLARYGAKPFLREQSVWAVAVHRFGRRVAARPEGLVKRALTAGYWLAFRVVETATGISLPREASIGGGLRIWHFGGIFVHPNAVIGRNCTLRQGVTIGNRREDGPAPVIGDDVEFGAYAQVLGGVRIGKGCRIGALSVVLGDVPDGATAIGIPARIVSGATEEGSLRPEAGAGEDMNFSEISVEMRP